MSGNMIGYVIWLACGLVFVIRGIYCMFAKKEVPFGFWANADTAPVSDVKAYNRAMGKLFAVFGILFILLGLPLCGGQNSAGIIFPILGSLALCIAVMAVYTVGIEGKYRKNSGSGNSFKEKFDAEGRETEKD